MKENKGKILTIVLIILFLASLFLAVGIFYLLQQEKQHSLSLQEELEDLKTKQKITESELERYRNTTKTLEAKLKEANEKINELNANIQAERKTTQIAQEQIEELKKSLEEQVSLRANLEEQLTQAKKETNSLKNQLVQLESQRSELETKIKELQAKMEKVELGTIVVSPEPEMQKVEAYKEQAQVERDLATQLEGKILVVNKEYNFVVINLGSKDGVKAGDIFLVYRGNTYLGEIKVEKVHDSMSAAGFVSPEMKQQVSEGDRILSKSK